MKVKTEKYNGFKIKIYVDEDAQNPFEDFDGEPPIAVYYDGRITEYSTQYGNVSEVPELTHKQIMDNKADILEMTETTSLLELARDGGQYSYKAVECINYAIQQFIEGEYTSKRLELLKKAYDWAEIPCYLGTTRGYSQGDYAEALVVGTNQWLEATGVTEENIQKQLKYAVKLFGYWSWGDVFGYVVEKVEKTDSVVGSCWGFYGDDLEESGLLESARSAIDYHIQSELKEKLSQTKTYIINKVPLIYRTA